MARVLSTAGVVTITDISAADPSAPEVDPDIINLSVRLLAVLDLGLTVVDPQPLSLGIGMSRSNLHDLARLKEQIELSLRHGNLPTDHRKAYWQRIVDGLASHGVHTDPETLQLLPFELLSVQAVRNELT